MGGEIRVFDWEQIFKFNRVQIDGIFLGNFRDSRLRPELVEIWGSIAWSLWEKLGLCRDVD